MRADVLTVEMFIWNSLRDDSRCARNNSTYINSLLNYCAAPIVCVMRAVLCCVCVCWPLCIESHISRLALSIYWSVHLCVCDTVRHM